MKKQRPLHTAALLSCALLFTTTAAAQDAKYWVGGSGDWSDAAHWALSSHGAGGAGAPRASESAWIIGQGERTVRIDGNVRCMDLVIDATHGDLVIDGPASAKLEVGGGFRANGNVEWTFPGDIEFTNDRGGTIVLSTHGISIASDIILNGSG